MKIYLKKILFGLIDVIVGLGVNINIFFGSVGVKLLNDIVIFVFVFIVFFFFRLNVLLIVYDTLLLVILLIWIILVKVNLIKIF